MSNIIIRNATLDDLEDIAKIELETFSSSEAASLTQFKERFKIYPENFFILEISSKIIGFIQGPTISNIVIEDDMYINPPHDINNSYLSVFGIAVNKAYQGLGYGRLLLNYYIDYAEKNNYKGIVLASRVNKVTFYEHLGFINLGISKSIHGNTSWCDMIYKIND